MGIINTTNEVSQPASISTQATYSLHLTDGKGFNYYDVVVIYEIVEIGDTLNVITDLGDMWMEIDSCYRYWEDDILRLLEYHGSWFIVRFELIYDYNYAILLGKDGE